MIKIVSWFLNQQKQGDPTPFWSLSESLFNKLPQLSEGGALMNERPKIYLEAASTLSLV